MAKPLFSSELRNIPQPLPPLSQTAMLSLPGCKAFHDRKTLIGILFVLKTGITWESHQGTAFR